MEIEVRKQCRDHGLWREKDAAACRMPGRRVYSWGGGADRHLFVFFDAGELGHGFDHYFETSVLSMLECFLHCRKGWRGDSTKATWPGGLSL